MSDTAPITFPGIRIKHPVPRPDETGTPDTDRKDSTQPTDVGTAYERFVVGALATVMDIDRFYDAVPGTSSQILTALEILKQAIDLLGQAQQSATAIETDRIVQRFKLLLPKLFQCRAVGDGFGMIITSVHVAFENLNGTPATQGQIRTIWRILRELRNVPAMSVDHAIRSIDEMEAAELEVDAPEVGTLLEEFDATDND
jgi:hypothetical protein